ncbi:hypothetical protein K6U06_07845 [Acidiferrimicrobium sp. IK]|uniref:RNase H family protein n=1 Tax=Acidiferrimicrobium sp. IK TaxID=2871700 RepID=UPI0021CB6555|nr:RNase H family protein [Acidiferrimicrobium sp. IK]MCU4184270.1 hypothetical protein [Acidiferrimicrobium sp. IK]
MTRQPTTVYTDGACSGNPGPGGWAWAVPGGAWANGAAAHTTNQRMEVQAVLEAVTTLDGPVDVVSDSTYVVNCFRDRWWEGWLRRGWTNSQKKPVANRDLWEPLIDAYRADPQRLQFRWVKGHSGDPMNDVVDRLAVAAATAQVGGRGDTPPTVLGPADFPVRRQPAARLSQPAAAGSPAAGAAAGPSQPAATEPPAGHRIVVTGLKPPALGGYDDPPAAKVARARLAEIVAAKAELHPDLVVMTGMGLGAEQLGAEAAADAGVPFIAVLPFPEQQRMWSGEVQRRFASLLERAAGVTVLEGRAPENRQRAGGALARRDAWLARHADEAIVVWDGTDAAVGRALRSLQDHLGEENVWVLEVRPQD